MNGAPLVLSEDLVWGINHAVLHVKTPLPVVSRRGSGRGGGAFALTGLREHARKPQNCVTCVWVSVLGLLCAVTRGKQGPT